MPERSPERSPEEVIPICIKVVDHVIEMRSVSSSGSTSESLQRYRCICSDCPYFRHGYGDGDEENNAAISSLVPTKTGYCALDETRPRRYWKDSSLTRHSYNPF